MQHSDSLPADYSARAPKLQRGVSFAAGDRRSPRASSRRATRGRYLFQLVAPKEMAKLRKETSELEMAARDLEMAASDGSELRKETSRHRHVTVTSPVTPHHQTAGASSRFDALARRQRVACVFRIESLAVQLSRHAGASPLARVEVRALQVRVTLPYEYLWLLSVTARYYLGAAPAAGARHPTLCTHGYYPLLPVTI